MDEVKRCEEKQVRGDGQNRTRWLLRPRIALYLTYLKHRGVIFQITGIFEKNIIKNLEACHRPRTATFNSYSLAMLGQGPKLFAPSPH